MIAHILTSARYARILRLLDLERKVILNGPLSASARSSTAARPRSTEVLDSESEVPEAFLAALKARAERNSRLILASLAGVRSGAAQIEQIRAARSQLRTYSAAGTPVEVREPTITRDQRA